ncbi:hypothetical protein [Staphylococcus xylosus]|uniref:hypothetical protein n=1 Tax=Staphylococcus xylosus TaxID=1288 RepID=UPI0019507211|nr:hypothetical protein [Staphylococcus xylosus]MBM6639457.1 hypothetical protein [Staphylococcus xylosus]
MSRKAYISAGLLTILLLLVVVGLMRLGGDNKPSEQNENASVENKQYSKKQYEQAEKRNKSQESLDSKMQEYIEKTNAPKSQNEYDEAIKMRSSEQQKSLERNVKDLVEDKDRSVENVSTYINYDSKNELSGSYDYTLSYKKDSKVQTENKNGEFTIKTNKDGYFYIDQFD